MKTIKTLMFCLCAALLAISCSTKQEEPVVGTFLKVQGQDIVKPNGEKFFIKGTNLGNWLNPEGYMFGFGKVNSAHFINEMFSQLVGPDETASFWKKFKDNYITEADIHFIASQGANTIRLPFHYKLFTDEDYMGLSNNQDGFARVDSVVKWCKKEGLYLILDMHDCPGGQTGDNIDDSYGYPWLLKSEASQEKFLEIWKNIAAYYVNEPTILGYELMNEAVATYFEPEYNDLFPALESLYRRGVEEIRKVDQNHIILLGGACWNSNFECIKDWSYDDNIMATCHRYGGEPTAEAIQHYLDVQKKYNIPMYMGEFGHNTMEWQSNFSKVLTDCNIGYTFWPYKKVDSSCMMGITRPENWKTVVDFAEGTRDTYQAIREARPDQKIALDLMNKFLENVKFENCTLQEDYIQSMNLK
ncbi:MAG: glycoside hydrolase family 5 protein [Bacteroidaceae bacterium]|nr:glycoside hydrolase family 5 protein [Bacteroidaceae bacterium]